MNVLGRHKVVVAVLAAEVAFMVAVTPVSSREAPIYVAVVVIPCTVAVWGLYLLTKRLGGSKPHS